MTLDITGPAGRLEARLDMPSQAPRAVIVLGSPHPQMGGTMQDRVLYHLAQGLLRAGIAVVRFNFRGVGTSAGTYDEGRGEQDDFRALLDEAIEQVPGVPVWAGGYSFGTHIAFLVGAADPRVSLLVGVAPLPDMFDFTPMIDSPKPKFLIHGAQDELATVQRVRRFYASLAEPRELVIIDAADHYFDGHASEVADAVEDLVADFPIDTPQAQGGSHHA